MKKLLFTLFLTTAAITIMAQDTSYILPGKGHINVEKLNGKIDTKMDISQLSISELRVLRNAFAARQGYLFESSELRSVFNATSWYDSLAWEREGNAEKMGPVKYTKSEQAFINRLKAREDQLRAANYSPASGIVNIDNIINPFQLEEFPQQLKDHLQQNGFGIVESGNEQIFQIYEANDYTMFPNFVTTDLYLQLFHLFLDTSMRKVEEGQLSIVIAELSKAMHGKMNSIAKSATNANMRDAAEWNTTFFAVAYQLMTNEALEIPAKYKDMSAKELENCNNTQNSLSEFLEYFDVNFAYSLFRPRGHYTRSEICQRYFRTMMWLQTVPFGTDKDNQLQRAALIAEAIASDATLKKAYDSVSNPITFLMGTPDNITILQVADIMREQGVSAQQLMKAGEVLEKFRKRVDEVAEQQTRIRPKFEFSSHNKINFMPQRYQPDGEVLQEMADCESMPQTKRDVPMGLDVMAALGSTAAERILIDELKQDKQWDKFVPNLNRMKQLMTTIDWKACITNEWLDALNALNTQDDPRLPYFMRTAHWQKKNLNATLASWAELKHDAILYAKQPFAAECGDGSLPAPVVKGYVEPNVPFWQKALALLDDTKNVMEKYNMLNEELTTVVDAMREELQFLLNVSNKELAGKKITNEEYDHIRYIGSTFEYLSLQLIKEPDAYLSAWSDVQGTDKQMALVADVYTANGENNPQKSILYEGVGPANQIYVVVEIDGLLRLMRGGVFSYREFKRPVDEQRLNDEEWQQKLKEYPNTGKPTWMDELIVPINQKPVDNEEIFYGTGC